MTMERLNEKEKIRAQVKVWKDEGKLIGFVPTMGALHSGHMNLVKNSVKECDRTIVSIFVNPTQFGEGEDLDKYPRPLETDLKLLEKANADLAFMPNEDSMYPQGFCTWVIQEDLTEKLCGRYRPVHFKGVCTVVTKLLNITTPDKAYFGRKDFQQSVIIQRMVQDLDIPVEIRVMPTVREHDGLAMSSRNKYLTPPQRRDAVCLYKTLLQTRQLFAKGEENPKTFIDAMQQHLAQYEAVQPEYTEIVAPTDLTRPKTASSTSIAAVAARIGETRLIDNMPLGGRLQDVFQSAPERHQGRIP